MKEKLGEEMNRNLELQKELECLHEEKMVADVRCTELKKALEEFIFATDKRDNEEKVPESKSLAEEVEGIRVVVIHIRTCVYHS